MTPTDGKRGAELVDHLIAEGATPDMLDITRETSTGLGGVLAAIKAVNLAGAADTEHVLDAFMQLALIAAVNDPQGFVSALCALLDSLRVDHPAAYADLNSEAHEASLVATELVRRHQNQRAGS